jgi:hypothetical protein
MIGITNTMRGAQGGRGSQGGTGWQGPTGFQGTAKTMQGVIGNRGAQGTRGSQGGTGYQGPTGFQGTANTMQGVIGNRGAQGGRGSQGGTGWQGPTGFQGTANGMKGITNAMRGAQGGRGSQGGTGWQGPTGFQGTANAMKGITNAMRGAQGGRGSQGDTGWQGPVGWQGSIGPQGAPGSSTSAPYDDGVSLHKDIIHSFLANSFSATTTLSPHSRNNNNVTAPAQNAIALHEGTRIVVVSYGQQAWSTIDKFRFAPGTTCQWLYGLNSSSTTSSNVDVRICSTTAAWQSWANGLTTLQAHAIEFVLTKYSDSAFCFEPVGVRYAGTYDTNTYNSNNPGLLKIGADNITGGDGLIKNSKLEGSNVPVRFDAPDNCHVVNPYDIAEALTSIGITLEGYEPKK